MTPVHASRRQPASGFGLIELLVTLTVLGAVLSVVFYALTGSQNQSTRVSKVAEERQMARTAVQLLEREMRMAGSGWGRTTVSSGGGLELFAVNFGYGGTASSDSVVLLGAWQAATTLASNMNDEASPLVVANVAGINAGDLVLVTDKQNQRAHLFEVTGVNTGTKTLVVGNSSPYNTGHTNWPPFPGYGSGSYLYKVTMSSYVFDSTSFQKPSIVRYEAGQPRQVVAYNVSGFRVWYQMQDGTWTRNPSDLNMVDKIIPVVFTRVTDAKLGTLRDSVWASIRPRTF
jgi:prepilin-type N-terminal cleavage/methylation domain-containing protein